jgi:pyruvate dehydrogenase E1 component alpha subunit
MPVAVGAGLSARLRRTDQVCLCFFGDGAANCGPFHESLNLAAVWRLPVVFLCENNGYAIHSAQSQTTAVPHVAQRAAAYAVHQSVSEAVRRARAGEGPTLVEAKTYRYCEHWESQGKVPAYRSAAEMAQWRARDPIELLVTRLQVSGELSEPALDALRASVQAEVDAAIAFAERSALPQPQAVFEDIFL